MSLFLDDRDVENGMLVYAEKPQTIHVCPRCGAEWEEIVDHDPIGVGTVWYEHDFDLTCAYPIRKGYCRACAMETATMEDRVAYLRENGLLCSFFASMLAESTMDRLDHDDMIAIWSVALRRDADALNQRLREYIEDQHNDDFVAWRCSE